jgi:hypothetical protein
VQRDDLVANVGETRREPARLEDVQPRFRDEAAAHFGDGRGPARHLDARGCGHAYDQRTVGQRRRVPFTRTSAGKPPRARVDDAPDDEPVVRRGADGNECAVILRCLGQPAELVLVELP